MLTDLIVYVQTKNTDLHTVSAFEALHCIMGLKDLKSLRRFRVLNLAFEKSSLEQAKIYLDTMVAKSFDLLNPNKETYHLGYVPEGRADLRNVYVDVRPRDADSESEQHAQYFRSRHGVPLVSFSSGVVWELGLDSSVQVSEDVLLDTYVWSRSSSQGLLAHPVQDSVRVLDLSERNV